MQVAKKENVSEIENLIRDWVGWLMTRKYYCKPFPASFLAKMQKDQRVSRVEPDADLNALCCAFNLVASESWESDRGNWLPFIFVYLPEFRPYKLTRLAIELGISRKQVYERAHNSATNYLNKAHQLRELNAQIHREVDGYVD